MELHFLFSFFAFWFGAIVGSFLNVVVWRVPRGMSIVSPPSACPNCGHRIRPWENIPILSWVFLGGSVPTGIAHAGSWVFSQAYSPNASSKIVSGADQPSYESDRFILLEDDEFHCLRVTPSHC